MRSRKFRSKSNSTLISRFFYAAALSSLTLLLFACPNPVSTDLVLSVVGTEPPNGATDVDPGQAIVVTFNKDLDPSSLKQIQSPITIAPSAANAASAITLSFSYNSLNKKLSIEPHPYLQSNAAYTVSFDTSLKDTSGETLPKQVDFSFTTGAKPAGDIQFNPDVPYITTVSDPVNLSIQYNVLTKSMRISNDQAAWKDTPLAPNVSWLLTPDDGTKTVYAQFFDSSNNPSAMKSISIVRDTEPPVITALTVPPYYNMYNAASNPPLGLAVSATDATSGIASYAWTGDSGVSFSSSSAQSPTITITGKDGTYNISLTVTDNAGNPAVRASTIIKDTVPPGAPTNAPTGYTTYPMAFDPPYDMTWYWSPGTTSNPYQAPDTFLILLNGKPPTSGSLSPSLPYYCYGTITAKDYGTYTLSVRQVDAAGNQSGALDMPITVSTVFPLDGSTNVSRLDALLWKDFSGNTAGSTWRVHLWDTADPSKDLGAATGNMRLFLPNDPLILGRIYKWYVEWSANGTKYASPSDGTFYKFTVSH